MFLRSIIAIIVIFIVWAALDFAMHGVILAPQYEETESLWRPDAERDYPVIYGSLGIAVIMFVAIYGFFRRKGLWTGFFYGLFFALAAGTPMAYGAYAVMPIPYEMTLTWFVGTLVKGALAGLIVGGFLKTSREEEAPKQEQEPSKAEGQDAGGETSPEDKR